MHTHVPVHDIKIKPTTMSCSTIGWWLVTLDGKQGWAPASFLEPKDRRAFPEGESKTFVDYMNMHRLQVLVQN